MIVMLAVACDATNAVYNALRREMPVDRVILEEKISTISLLRRRIKKLGIVTVAGQIAFQLLVPRLLRLTSAKRAAEIRAQYAVDLTALPAAVISHVPSANDEETALLLRELRPDVVIVSGTRILSDRLLRAVDAPFVNMHAGITPLYRGVHGAYWALAQNDAAHCGVTVHLVDRGIDTGAIAAQATIAPARDDDFTTYPLLQLAAGIPLLVRTVLALRRGERTTIPAPDGPSRLWSHPTLWSYLRTRISRGVR